MLRKLVPKTSRRSGGGADTKPAKARKGKAVNKSALLFGLSIEDLGAARALRLVNSCAAILREPAALSDPALFRGSSVSDAVLDAAVLRVQSGEGALRLQAGETHAVAAVLLKRWMVSLPTPLVPRSADGSAESALLSLPGPQRQVACTILLCVRHILDEAAGAGGRPPTAESLAAILTPALLYGASGGPTSGDREAVARKVKGDGAFTLQLLQLSPQRLAAVAAFSDSRHSVATTAAGTAYSASYMASSVGSLPALAPSVRESSAEGPADLILIELSSISLHPALAAKYATVQIEVDMPGPDEPRVTPAAPLIAERGQPALANLDWDSEYAAAADSVLGRAIRASLDANDGEADILFAVLVADADGVTTELGAARCSLEALLAGGDDYLDEEMPILDESNREIGTITCSVAAANALVALAEAAPARAAAAAPARRSADELRPNSPPPDRLAGTAMSRASTMLSSEVASRELRTSFDDLRTHSVKVMTLARAVRDTEPAADLPRELIRRPNGDEGLILGGDDVIHELRAALAAWDAASGGTMEELVASGALTTSQRKLLLHATTEVRLAKRAWGAHKRELRTEREELADEIWEFSRKLNLLKAGSTSGAGAPDSLEVSKGGDSLRSEVEVSGARDDVLRSGVQRELPLISSKPAEATKPSAYLPAERVELSTQADEYLQVRARVRHHPLSAAGMAAAVEQAGGKPLLAGVRTPAPPPGRTQAARAQAAPVSDAARLPPLDLRASHGQGFQAPVDPAASAQQSPYNSYAQPQTQQYPLQQWRQQQLNLQQQQQEQQQQEQQQQQQYPYPQQQYPQQPTTSYAAGPRVVRESSPNPTGHAPGLDPYSTARFMSAAAAAHLLRQHAAGASAHGGLDPRAAVSHARQMTGLVGGPSPAGAAGAEQLRRSLSAVPPAHGYGPVYPGGYPQQHAPVPANAFAAHGSAQAAYNAGFAMPHTDAVRRSLIPDHSLAASRAVWSGHGYAY